jgi:hypothetical protein
MKCEMAVSVYVLKVTDRRTFAIRVHFAQMLKYQCFWCMTSIWIVRCFSISIRCINIWTAICYRVLKFPQRLWFCFHYTFNWNSFLCCQKIKCVLHWFLETVITGAVCLDMLLKCLWLQLTQDIYQGLIHFKSCIQFDPKFCEFVDNVLGWFLFGRAGIVWPVRWHDLTCCIPQANSFSIWRHSVAIQFTRPYCSRLFFYGSIWKLKFLLTPSLTLTAIKMQFVRRLRMLRRTLSVASWPVYLGDGSNALIVM